MKAIVSRKCASSKTGYHETGTLDQVLFTTKAIRYPVRTLLRKAVIWAKGVPIRVQLFLDEQIYSEPFETFLLDSQGMIEK